MPAKIRVATPLMDEQEPLPLRRPWKCPVCNGAGTVSRPPNVPGDSPYLFGGQMFQCPACKGTCIVWG